MRAHPDPILSSAQKTRLALRILLSYWLVRVYISAGSPAGGTWRQLAFFWTLELLLTFFLFRGWVGLIDWLQERLLRQAGTGPANALRWPTQVVSLVVAVGLALLFSTGYGAICRQIHTGPGQHSPTRSPSETGQRNQPDNRQRTNDGLVFMAMLSAFYLTVSRRSGQQQRALQQQEASLRQEAMQAQLDALSQQASPHFLFSSLGVLTSLVTIDTNLSVRFINRLSKAYRYILDQRTNERASLKAELNFIEAYAFLLTIRFDDRLQVQISVPDATRIRYAVVPLTLQVLVDNAVKHNRISDQEPLIITIMAAGETLRISNPIRPRSTADHPTGTGLQAISKRYRLLTDQPVRVGEHDGDFVVIIPLLRSERLSE